MKRLLGILIIVFIVSIPLDLVLLMVPEIWYLVPISYAISASLFGLFALAMNLIINNPRRFK